MSIPSIFSDDTEPSLAWVTPTLDWRIKLTAADEIEFIDKNTSTTVLKLGPTGVVSFVNFTFPSSDGVAGQVLTTDGEGSLGFTPAGTGTISNIVDDTTPQLGGDLDAQNFKIINLAMPTSDTDAATKAYVDSLAAGLDPKESVRLATAGGELSTFTFTNNGGVGDILTAPGVGFTSVDGNNLVDGDRVLVKNQSVATQNGIYVASDTGSGGITVLTRATDQDGSPTNEVSAGNFTFVEQGTVNTSTGWVVIGDGIIIINVGNIDWAKFSDVSGALVDIIGDTTPQLGGNLDVNNFSIISTSNENISITPNGFGSVILDGLSWPIADGTFGQVLTTDGEGSLSFTFAGGLNEVVEDLSPQLGAQLDVNTFGLGDGVNLLLGFVEDVLAVNYIEIENEESGSGPVLRATGADSDVDLNIQPQGTGIVIVGISGDSEIRGDINSGLTIGGGDSDTSAVGGNTTILSGDGSGAFASGNIFITPGTGGAGDGDLILSGLIWPIVDGTSGQALTTNGAGTLGFATVGAGSLSNIIEDTSPQLGSDLDVNGQSIVSVSAGDIAITPDTTGSVVLDGLNWPQADGTVGQALTTDGSGSLSFTTIAGGGGSAFTTQIATSTPIAAVDDDEILVDTSSLAITVNLPGSPTLGDRVRIIDGAGNAATNNITVGRAGEVIMGVAADFIINQNNAGGEFVYMDGTNGWRVVNNV